MKRIKEFLQTRLETTKKNQKGFSLVELIIVIAILGIIAAIALPNVTSAVSDARKNTDLTNAKALANAVIMARAKDDTLTGARAKGPIVTTSTIPPFDAAVAKELNGGVPKAKYRTYTEFQVEVSATGEITIYAVDKGESPADEEMVYPTPTGVYAG